MLVHQGRGAGLVVQLVGGTLVVGLQRQVQGPARHGPVQARGGLPARLRPDAVGGELPGVDRGDGRGVGDEVDVLAHGVEAGLDREVVAEGILAGQAQLGVDVELGRMQGEQAAEPQASLEGQLRGHGPFVAGEQRGFQGVLGVQMPGPDERVLAIQRSHGARLQAVVGGVGAERQVVGVAGGVAEVQLGEALADARVHGVAGQFVLSQAVLQPGSVLVIAGGRGQVEPAGQAAAPLQRSVEVGVAEGRVACEGEPVVGPVEISLEGVGVVELVGQGGVDVVEGGEAAGIIAGLGQLAQQPV